jgi:hypothetical protein
MTLLHGAVFKLEGKATLFEASFSTRQSVR